MPQVPKGTIEESRKTRVFEAGDIFHAWMQGITKEAGISLAQEIELTHPGLNIVGHIDDLIQTETGLILYDYKTVHSKSFYWAKKSGMKMSHYHRYQLGTYMYLLRESTYPELVEARILKISKDDLAMSEHELLWGPELEEDIVMYWTVLNRHWDERTLPPCTCGDVEPNPKTGVGFMALEKWNPYFYKGEPCSIEWYKEFKRNQEEP